MSEGIAYQNKDIEFKLLSESFKERSFEAYGLKLPKIKEVLPTNLPSVTANEMRMDNLFLLEDGTYAIVDYESVDKAENRIKYINYIGRVMERYYKDNNKIPNIRLIVIYTGDVEEAESELKTKCITLQIEQVFVNQLPVQEIYQSIGKKLKNNETLTEQELMQLIILPLAEKGKDNKQKRIEQVVEFAKKIENEKEQVLVLSGLLVASDKFISRENAESIRRWLVMTKVFQIFEEEKQEALQNALQAEKRKTAEKLLKKEADMEFIMYVTDLAEEEIRIIQESMITSNPDGRKNV